MFHIAALAGSYFTHRDFVPPILLASGVAFGKILSNTKRAREKIFLPVIRQYWNNHPTVDTDNYLRDRDLACPEYCPWQD
jgi:hypothetical protein